MSGSTPDPPTYGPVPPAALVPIRTYARQAGVATDHSRQRIALRPIAAWRIDDSRFRFDSSFIRPIARTEIDDLARLHRTFPASPMSIFAHTDPVGDDAYNKPLSGRRALALYGVLVRDVDLWEELYKAPMAGDQWGQGAIDEMFDALGFTSVAEFQENNVDANGNPLDVDGWIGPATRKSLYRAYMDFLCTDDDGNVLELTDDNFLARGADPDHRGDVQGCGEFNPLMVFSTEEHQRFQAWAHREERNAENSVNRRAVVFLYPADVVVDVAKWPCPAARTGMPECKQRFWSDAQTRRNPQEARRHFDGDFDTFACRFYHYFGFNTPAETPIHLGLTLDIYVHHGGHGPGPGRYRLESDDGVIDKELDTGEALPLEEGGDSDVRLLSFTMLPATPTYTLSFRPENAGPDFEPVVLIESFTLGSLGPADSDEDPDDYLERDDEGSAQILGVADGPEHDQSSVDDPEAEVETETVAIEGIDVTIRRTTLAIGGAPNG